MIRSLILFGHVVGVLVLFVGLGLEWLSVEFGVLRNDWMRASYGALALMAVVAGLVAGPRMRALRRAAEDPSERGLAALHMAASKALLRAALYVRIAFGLAVVYL